MDYKKTRLVWACFVLFFMCQPGSLCAKGNQYIYSIQDAKKILERDVYYDFRRTFYCLESFDESKTVYLSNGFGYEGRFVKRLTRVEWEHLVPAENFGRHFEAWRNGHPECVNDKGESFKGRNCAEKVSLRYRLMQADMHNLVPAIGAVNAERSNYDFVHSLSDGQYIFNECPIAFREKKVAPPDYTKGAIARAYLYMAWAYAEFSLSAHQQNLMSAWNQMYPPSQWECLREKRVHALQGNGNHFVSQYCHN